MHLAFRLQLHWHVNMKKIPFFESRMQKQLVQLPIRKHQWDRGPGQDRIINLCFCLFHHMNLWDRSDLETIWRNVYIFNLKILYVSSAFWVRLWETHSITSGLRILWDIHLLSMANKIMRYINTDHLTC